MTQYAPKFITTTLKLGKMSPTVQEADTLHPDLRSAEGWIVAEMRGNNGCSRDKSIHQALDGLCRFLDVEKVIGPVRKRLDAMLEHQDALGPVGRAVLVACWSVRIYGDWAMDHGAWTLIMDAEVLCGTARKDTSAYGQIADASKHAVTRSELKV